MIPKMVQAVLTPDSHQKLLKNWGDPVYKKIYAHHVTIAYQSNEADMQKINGVVGNGQPVVVLIGRRFWANGVEAVEAKVWTKDGKEVPIKNARPHITISTDNKPPVLSNDMLQGKGEFKDGFDGVQLIKQTLDTIIEYV